MHPGLIKLVDNFKSGNGRKYKHGGYAIDDSTKTLIYVPKDSFNIQTGAIEILARKITTKSGKTLIIGNSNKLKYAGVKKAYGREIYDSKRNPSPIQEAMRNAGFFMLPFTVFQESGLSLESIEIIDQGPEEDFTIKDGEPKWNLKQAYIKRHFTGATLFSVDSQYFLFDVDRREIKHKIFNPFLSKVPGKPKTITEAYENLKPKEVIKATKEGKSVLRQGEWFFIPVKVIKAPKVSKQDIILAGFDERTIRDTGVSKKLVKEIKAAAAVSRGKLPRRMELKAGPNRPNHVELGFTIKGTTYVSGTVTHSGREHAPLGLEKGVWYKAVPNTAIESFTIRGDID